MGLQCSILGHAFEPAGVEHEREEQGSEVITTEREIERCRRCGAERVVSESTEVTAVVDAETVGLEDDDSSVEETDDDLDAGGGLAGAVDRSGIDADGDTTGDPAGSTAEVGETLDDSPSVADAEEGPEYGFDSDEHADPPDPETEDAEILTDEEDDTDPERAPGQWPEETDPAAEDDDVDPVVETDAPIEVPKEEEESLSGITVPEGDIVCPDCGFRVEAHSGYREGDPCPECNAWLEAERNQ